MEPPFAHCRPGRRTSRFVCGVVLLWVVQAASAAVTLTERKSHVHGSFVVGFATLNDVGSDSETLTDIVPSFDKLFSDAGSVDGTYRSLPVAGSGSYLAQQTFTVDGGIGDVRSLRSAGRAEQTLTCLSAPYMSCGSLSGSTLWLYFDVREAMPFTFSADVDIDPIGAARGPEGGVSLTGPGVSVVFGTAGHHSASGMLRSGTYLYYGNASGGRSNGAAAWNATLVLGAVPEPRAWALLAAGIGLLLLRRPTPWPGLRIRAIRQGDDSARHR